MRAKKLEGPSLPRPDRNYLRRWIVPRVSVMAVAVYLEWTEILGSVRLTGALLDRLTHHVHILEMNGDSFRLKQSRRKRTPNS